MSKAVIIVAGGTGSRMKQNMPKQFLEIHEKPIIIHTIERFLSWDKNLHVIAVVHKDYFTHWNELALSYFSEAHISSCVGGETRFHSVKNGLELVADEQIVAVHDAARPLVSSEVIESCFKKAENGAAIPTIPVFESMREVTENGSSHVDRNQYVLVQTPQCFQREILLRAYELPYRKEFTDDASVVEAAGEKVNLVSGNRENIKITEPADLAIAKALLS